MKKEIKKETKKELKKTDEAYTIIFWSIFIGMSFGGFTMIISYCFIGF